MFKLVIPALAALSLTAPALAEDPDTVTVSVHVPYADLDLAGEAGAATLQARIARAVKKVCSRPEDAELGNHAAMMKCREMAMAGAMRQLAAAHIDMPAMALAR